MSVLLFKKSRNLLLVFTGLLFLILPLGSAGQRKITKKPHLYKRKGIASYYAGHFEDKATSTGESFKHRGMTAASNTLPLNTYVKVTNLKNGEWVIVRINDRMAQHNKRLIDLSRSAAKKIKMIKPGLVRVSVEVIPRKFFTFFSVYNLKKF